MSFPSDPSAAAAMVGSLVMGSRIGGAAGREIAEIEDDSDMARKVHLGNELNLNRRRSIDEHSHSTFNNLLKVDKCLFFSVSSI